MQPLSNTIYWRGIIQRKAWRQLPSEDLVQAVVNRSGAFHHAVLDAVVRELLDRCERISKAWSKYDAAPDELEDAALDLVTEAVANPGGKEAAALSSHFASVIIYAVRMARRKRQRRAVIAPTSSIDDDAHPFVAPATMVHADHRRTQLMLDVRTQMASITDPQTLELLRLRAGGMTNGMAARTMGISLAQVRSLLEATGLRGLFAA